jgi:hypothetical protein
VDSSPALICPEPSGFRAYLDCSHQLFKPLTIVPESKCFLNELSVTAEDAAIVPVLGGVNANIDHNLTIL